MTKTNKVLGMILFMILIVGMFGTVSAVNVYPTITPFKSETGHLYVEVSCQHNLFSKDMILVNDAAPNTNVTISLKPNGKFDDFFVGGNYTLTLLDGNAGHPETKKFVLRNGYDQKVMFIGHAVTFDHGCPLGQERVNGVCVQKECDTGMTLNQTSGECEPIVCPVGMHLVGNDCVNDCVPALNIVDAKYGFTGTICRIETITDVPAHTEYRYWISGTPAHTEYRFSDFVNDTFKQVCYPEVNHTEYQVSTYQIVKEAVPATPATGRLAEFTCTKYFIGMCIDGYYESGHEHAIPAPNDNPLNPNRFVYNGHTYKIVGNPAAPAFIITQGTPASSAEYGWVITTSFTDGACPLSVSCVPDVGDTKCEQRIVKDADAYCETVIDVAGHQGEFSKWCNNQPEEKDGRIIETRQVPDDMVNGHYSNWSDIPEGSCAQVSIACVTPVNDACQTQNVPAVTHDVKVCDGVNMMADVTQNVKDVVASGHTSFVFDNRPSPGGIFDIVGGTLLSPIDDPAYGYVKTVEITFNMGCDSKDQTVTGNEYDVITVGEGTYHTNPN